MRASDHKESIAEGFTIYLPVPYGDGMSHYVDRIIKVQESSNNHLKSCRLPRHLDEEEIYPFRVFKFRIHCLAAKRNAKGEGSLVEFSIGKDM